MGTSTPPPHADGLRIATWNVESIRAHHDQVVAWTERNQIDVLCMQETKCPTERFPRDGFRSAGYDLATYGGEGGRGGVAAAHRVPITDPVMGIPGAVAPLADPLSMSFSVDLSNRAADDLKGTGLGVAPDPLRVHTCYAPNGRKVGTRHHEIKLAWFALYAAWLGIERADHPEQLVVGDLNIAPLDVDIWEPSRYRKRNLTSPRERLAFDALLDDGALVDIVRNRFGDEAVFTWWNRRSDFYETDRGWRLDHMLATPASATRIDQLWVDRAERGRSGSTDHAPVVCDISRS